MVRTQVQLTEEQHRRLRTAAQRRGVSLAELVREGVDQVLEHAERGEQWQRLWRVVGTCHDRRRAKDVARRHDAYLAEAWSRGRRVR